jgi:hypothetical protein
MDARQWAVFATESGIQADRTVKAFTPTWGGFSVDPVGDIHYYDFGTIVAMWAPANLLGTSNGTPMTISNIPEAIRPNVEAWCLTMATDNGNSNLLATAQVTAAGQMLFHLGDTATLAGRLTFNSVATGFTAAGSKGVEVGWFIMYAQ